VSRKTLAIIRLILQARLKAKTKADSLELDAKELLTCNRGIERFLAETVNCGGLIAINVSQEHLHAARVSPFSHFFFAGTSFYKSIKS